MSRKLFGWLLGLLFPWVAQAQLPLPNAQPDLDLRTIAAARAVIATGDGGAIVAGDFVYLGDSVERFRIARIRADGSIDPDWNVSVNNGAVYRLLRSGDRLFLLGSFYYVNGVARRGLAEVSLASGALAGWNPTADTNPGGYFDDGVVVGDHLYVGGIFTQIGTTARTNLAKIHLNSGAVDPVWTPVVDAAVTSVSSDGSAIYIGGNFTQVNGNARGRAAKLDTASGAADAWAPNFNGQITNAEVDGGHYYAVGCFSAVNGTVRGYLARVDTGSGALDATWNPTPGGGCTYGLSVTATQVYVGGAFQTLGGQPARTVARVSKSGSGAVDTGFAPQLTGGTFTFAILEMGAGAVLLLGDFEREGGQYTPGLARVNQAGALQTPAIYSESRGYAQALLDMPDGGTLVGGVFSRARNLGAAGLRRGLLKLDANGAHDATFNTTVRGSVQVLRRTTSNIYVGGFFNEIGGVGNRHLARTSLTGVVDAGWNPAPDGAVNDLQIDETNGRLYVGGSFYFIDAQARNRIAELQLADGSATAWNPNANGSVYAIQYDASAVYAGGDFSSIGGLARGRLAKLARTGAGAAEPAFAADASSGVRALLLGPGDSLYVGGIFSTLGALGRPGFGRILRSSGAPDPAWNSFLDSGGVYSLAPASDGLYVGGYFNAIGGVARGHLARLSHTGAVAPLFAPPLNSTTLCAVEQGARVIAGGYHNYSAPIGSTQISVVALAREATPVATTTTISSDQPENSQPFQTYRVAVNVTGSGGIPAANQSVAIEDDQGATCSIFLDAAGNGGCELASREAGTRTLTARFAGTPLMLASVDTETHTVSGTSTTPPVNTAIDLRTHSAPIASVRLSDGSLVIGGSFTRVGSLQRRGLAKLRPDGSVDPDFSADVFGFVTSLARDGNDHIYVNGFFGYIDGVLRRNLAKLDANGNVLPGWSAGNTAVTSSNRSVAVDAGGDLLVLGPVYSDFSTTPSSYRIPLFKLSGANGAVIATYAAMIGTNSTSVFPSVGLHLADGWAYLYGRFERVNGVARRNLARVDLATGTLDGSWDPSPNQRVHTLVANGGGLYLGGDFTEIAGQPVTYAARLTASGALDPVFAPASNSRVQQFLPANGALYASGFFNTIGGLSRYNLAKLDPVTGVADAGFASPEVLPGDALNVLGNALWAPAGANLFSASDVRIMGAARLDAATAAELGTEFISRPARVFALARQPDGGTLIGGNFARIGSLQRNLVRVTQAGQYDTGFSPPLASTSSVQAIKVLANGDIYVGETFRVFKLSATGVPDAAFGNAGSVSTNSNVQALASASDGLLVGGFFSTIGGSARNGLAKIDFGSGAVAAFNAALSTGGVRALALDVAGNIYLGGGFTTVAGTPRARLAKLDASGALLSGWQADANSTVNAILPTDDGVYIGGFFSTIAGAQRRGVGRVGIANGTLDAWNPASTRQVSVYALATAQDGDILVGGSFNFIGNEYRSNAAKLDPVTALADSDWNPSFDAAVYAILPGYGDTPTITSLPHIEQNIAFGGDFEFAGAVPMPGFVAVPSVGSLPERIFCGGFEAGGCAPLP